MEQQGFIALKAPQAITDVWLGSGRHVRPDDHGVIHVHPNEAAPLTAVGWQIVPPEARWKPPAAA
jgi:hypothetical protein